MQDFLNINNINLYFGSILLALSAVMFMIPIPQAERWRNFRTGRSTLAIAYIVLGVLMIVGGIIGNDNSVMSGMMTLIIAFFQALLYTRICILFLKPRSFDGFHYKTLLAASTVFSIGMAVSYVVMPAQFAWVFYTGLALYASLLLYCSMAFIRNYNESLKRLEYVYDEDMNYRVRWVKRCFYSALLIGVMAWFMAVFHASEGLNILCIFVFTIYYLCMVGYFIRYVSNYNFILKSDEWNEESGAAYTAAEPVAVSHRQDTKEDKLLTERLEKWVGKKKYRDRNKTLDEIVKELNTTRTVLNEYMNAHFGMNFRAWRNGLRIEEAKRLLTDSDMSVGCICATVGYSDRSNFHNQFTETVGMTPLQYRNRHKG